MAGKLCPNCGRLTFYKTVEGGRQCTACNYEMRIPKEKSTKAYKPKVRGERCSNCNTFNVVNKRCLKCGAIFILPEQKRRKR